MSDIAIKVENLGKSYLVGHESAGKEHYTALRDVLARNAKSFARKTKDMLSGKPIVQGDEVEEFWALKDINFEIKQGERVGVIGRNGAGKSTLLKILSRITEPTTGRVSINGRVASLLEVGTGFHPELTGRENIYLNGAILGMSRKEIQRKFDEIVDFAEVEKFLDTPVKRYSSGMYVRLAFAVAAHLEPEILIVDEVLAVGDAEFQRKCLGKMRDVSVGGRTVIFVSHSMSAVSSLCTRCLLFSNGKLALSGTADDVIQHYADTTGENYDRSFEVDLSKPTIARVSVDRDALRRNDLKVSIQFKSPFLITLPIGGVVLKDCNGIPVWGSNGRFHERQTDTKNIDE
jgi:lipopolysaccharide transport system ATP-binding protein